MYTSESINNIALAGGHSRACCMYILGGAEKEKRKLGGGAMLPLAGEVVGWEREIILLLVS